MIVHLGVIVIAVALAASNSYTRNAELTLEQGSPVEFAGHTFELGEVTSFEDERAAGVRAAVIVDGDQAYSPAITRYLNFGIDVGTPSVRSTLAKDIYLPLSPGAQPGDTSARIRVFINRLIMWLWIGGGMMVAGTLLAAFPGRRRRRPTDPVSAPGGGRRCSPSASAGSPPAPPCARSPWPPATRGGGASSAGPTAG